MPNEDRLKALLKDLGRSTLRGVRKCPNCGTLNGIRGLMCKNKACDQVFKDAGERRKNTTEVCRLVTGTTTQVFSVRVRDKGPDYRGFVQLPLGSNSLSSRLMDPLINEPSAVCFVENCQRIFNTNILKCHESSELQPVTTCQHIQAATRCFATAVPLTIDNTVLFSLNMPTYIKQAIWQHSVVALGPLVQRVSRTIMVVKCKVTSKHPLGYLHVTFSPAKTKDTQHHFYCSCPTFKGQGSRSRSEDVVHDRRCLHYYACIAAFAADEKLSEEFASFVDQERPQEFVLNIQEEPVTGSGSGDGEGEEGEGEQVVTFLRQYPANVSSIPDSIQVEVEVLQQQNLTTSEEITQEDEFPRICEVDVSDICLQNLEVMPELVSDPISVQPETPQTSRIFKFNGLKRKKEDKLLIAGTQPEPKKPRKKPEPASKEVKDESEVNQTFLQWLATVTERINQQMHYQFSGKPAPLVFHTPQEFFDCLRERISYGGKKRRLPNLTSAFVRKHAVPLGTFTKYTWHINNIIHCKQIFETPLMPLEITRSFVENVDGTYDAYEASNLKDEAYSKMDNVPKIRPLELKTYLKVGNTSPDQKVPTPMIIEWIPDILPKTKVGELKITFEFGHRRP